MTTTPRTPISIDELAQAIQVRIMTGEIPLGSWLRQERLAEEFGVSRTPVREAIRALQSAGIVELVPNRGARVRGPSLRDIREAYVVRAELEGLAAELAAERMTPSALRTLREADLMFAGAARSFAAMGDGGAERGLIAQVEWSAANDRFHLAIQDAADNLRLSRLIAELHSGFPRSLTSRPLLAEPRLIEENVEQHHAIREALERKDPAASRAAMRAHVLRAGELVGEWFAEHRDD